MWQVLQTVTIITKWDVTPGKELYGMISCIAKIIKNVGWGSRNTALKNLFMHKLSILQDTLPYSFNICYLDDLKTTY